MRILIVEDEKRLAQFLKKGFEAESMAVDIARDGDEGAALGREGDYDVIVLDLMLPGKDGLSVLREIRSAGKPTPILILSARGDVEDRIRGLNLGADDYLPKPFAFAEVLARVRALLRRQSAEGDRGSVLRADDLSVDLLSRKATRGGREIELTNKEFQLLEYLLRSKNRVLSRVLIIEHIWDMQFDGGTNVVDVVINRLRRKIDDGARHPLIRTVRGVGYVLEEPPREDPG
jgi:two-component system copper resistance phosphate regulon response regulator CusR